MPKKHEPVVPSRQGCECPEPVGDPRIGQCVLCGHQVKGYEIPVRPYDFTIGSSVNQSTVARKRRRHGFAE